MNGPANTTEIGDTGPMNSDSGIALTASDRCDRCGAQAYLRVNLASGGELLFCAHHAREHGDKIKALAVNVHDETGKLLPAQR